MHLQQNLQRFLNSRFKAAKPDNYSAVDCQRQNEPLYTVHNVNPASFDHVQVGSAVLPTAVSADPGFLPMLGSSDYIPS